MKTGAENLDGTGTRMQKFKVTLDQKDTVETFRI